MKNQEITKSCWFCGEMFTALRQTAKFCSNTCRTKANNQRRENEIIEAQKAKVQADLDELKRKTSDTRKLKKTKKDAEIAAAKRLVEIELEIQAEIDAFELTIKNQGIISIVEMLRVRAETKEKQLLTDDALKKLEEKYKLYRKLKAEKEQSEMFVKGWIELIQNVCKRSIKSENLPAKPDTIIPPNLPRMPGNSVIPQNPNPSIAGQKATISPMLNGMHGHIISNTPGLPTQNKPNTPSELVNIVVKVLDDILDCIHIF